MNTAFRLLLPLALGPSIVFPALADPPMLPASCKVMGARRVTVGKFEFTEAQLQDYYNRHFHISAPADSHNRQRRATLAEVLRAVQQPSIQKLVQPNDPGIVETCGVVDRWLFAAADAYTYCNAPSIGNGQAYFSVSSPNTFNEINHHAKFTSFAHGLKGTCYICVAPRRKDAIGTAQRPPADLKAAEPAEGP